MFKPHKYSKTTEYSPRKSKSKGINVGKYVRAIALRTVIASALIVAGIYIMFTQIFIPVVATYATSDDMTPIISPIAGNANSSLSLKDDEDFKFQELNASFRNKDVSAKEATGAMDILKTLEGTEDSETDSKDKKEPEYFYLSIPSLKIEDAKVEVNSTNLDPKHALGHYKGTCLPDEACNALVFGHSTFKGSNNRYKQGDYTEIFAHLDELKYGDEFSVKYNDHEYKYVVELTKVDRPENVNPLEQPLPRSLGKHESTMQLFTCTPPGTTKYRLSVVGKLVN